MFNAQAAYLEERDKTVMDLLQQVLTSVWTSACPIDPELLLQLAKHHADQRSHASVPPQVPPAISPSTNEMPDNDAHSHQNQSTLPSNVTAPLQALEPAANEPASDSPASGPVSDCPAGPAEIVARREDMAGNLPNGDSSDLSEEDDAKQAEPNREATPSNKRKVQGGKRNTQAVKKAKTTRKATGKGK